MLRAFLHVLVSGSLVAAAPQRSYEGAEAAAPVEAIDDSIEEASVPEPPEPVEVVLEVEGPSEDYDEYEDDDDELAYDPLIDSPEALRARSWVRSGAVFTGVGGVLTLGAILMSQARVNTSEEQEVCTPGSDIAGNGCLAEARGRAVLALALPGALLLAGGIAMLITGKVQQRRLRTTLRASRRELVLGLRLAF